MTYQLTIADKVETVVVPQITFGILNSFLDQLDEDTGYICYVNIAPDALALAHLHRLLGLDSEPGEFRYLDTALLNGTPALAVDDRREDQCSLDAAHFVEQVIVHGPLGRVLLDKIANILSILDVPIHFVATLPITTIDDVGNGKNARPGDLDPHSYKSQSATPFSEGFPFTYPALAQCAWLVREQWPQQPSCYCC